MTMQFLVWLPACIMHRELALHYTFDMDIDCCSLFRGIVKLGSEDGSYQVDPDPAKSARDVRDAFGRMGMNDSQTVGNVKPGWMGKVSS